MPVAKQPCILLILNSAPPTDIPVNEAPQHRLHRGLALGLALGQANDSVQRCLELLLLCPGLAIKPVLRLGQIGLENLGCRALLGRCGVRVDGDVERLLDSCNLHDKDIISE